MSLSQVLSAWQDHPFLPRALESAPRSVELPGVGRLGYYRTGNAGPEPALVLVHSVKAAGSSREMQPLVRAFPERSTYALDWPGFGISDRADRRYEPSLFAAALTAFIRTIVLSQERPVDLIALSLGCEFATRAALDCPELFRSLVLISPTGVGQNKQLPKLREWAVKAKRHPQLARVLFRGLTSSYGTSYFLGRSFHGPPNPDLVEYAAKSARQPGAEHAALAFIAGDLFTPDAYESLYRRLQAPTLVLFDRDPDVTFDRLDSLCAENPRVRASRIEPTQGLPHFERPDAVSSRLRQFYSQLDSAGSTSSP